MITDQVFDQPVRPIPLWCNNAMPPGPRAT
jgi:hypothetical protein